MDEVAGELGLIVKTSKTGRNSQPADPEPGVKYISGIGVYWPSVPCESLIATGLAPESS
jgi:hypothetical protein